MQETALKYPTSKPFEYNAVFMIKGHFQNGTALCSMASGRQGPIPVSPQYLSNTSLCLELFLWYFICGTGTFTHRLVAIVAGRSCTLHLFKHLRLWISKQNFMGKEKQLKFWGKRKKEEKASWVKSPECQVKALKIKLTQLHLFIQ